MNTHNYAVIIAGGSGERFWPLSTQARPKQFVSLFGGKPLIRHAVDRLEGVVPPERILIVTSASLAAISAEACGILPVENIVGEPCRRDTAAACALACGLVKARDPEGVAAILTADQLMADVPSFRRILADSFVAASHVGNIVTIGVTPDYPATGFGYIETGDKLDFGTSTPFCKAKRFVEKPDHDTAVGYLESGRFCWNAGMFIWHVKTMAEAVARLTPDLAVLIDLPSQEKTFEALNAKLAEVYPGLRKISVDYAIMEHYENIVMANGAFGWDDVGTWPSISKHFEADDAGNMKVGVVETLDSSRNIVIGDGSDKIVALIGCDDMIVVQTGKATLVCPKSRAQDLKKLVQQIGKREDGAKFV